MGSHTRLGTKGTGQLGDALVYGHFPLNHVTHTPSPSAANKSLGSVFPTRGAFPHPQCEACRSLHPSLDLQIESPESLECIPFHQSFASLEASAIGGCRACDVVRRTILYEQPTWGAICNLRKLNAPVSMSHMVLNELDPYRLWVRYGPCESDIVIVKVEDKRKPSGMNFLVGRTRLGLREKKTAAELASYWLNYCIENHVTCNANLRAGNPLLPTRVIAVGSINSPLSPSLQISQGRKGRYCALSYCWGGMKSSVETTTSTLPEYEVRLPWESIPKTLQDAIIITRQLEIDYLWIDCFCILQNCNLDWQRESGEMKNIYRNAICTIAATGSANSDDGMLHDRLEPSYWSRVEDNTNANYQLLESWPKRQKCVAGAPINTRGWTMQEHLLSSRIIHWSPHELFWECKTCIISESDYHQIDPNQCEPFQTDEHDDQEPSWLQRFRHLKDTSALVGHNDLQRHNADSAASETLLDDIDKTFHKIDATHMWWYIVEEYSSRHLSEEKDRLPGLSGLASLFQAITGQTYLAGLWRENLVSNLQWVVDQDKENTRPSSRPGTFVAPSWSWASIVGSIRQLTSYTYLDTERNDTLEILSCSTELAGSDNFGQVTSGMLRVRGNLRRVASEDERSTKDAERVTVVVDETLRNVHDFLKAAERLQCSERDEVILTRFDVWNTTRYARLFFLAIGWASDSKSGPRSLRRVQSYGLLLVPTGKPNEYTRVGFAACQSSNSDLNSNKATITIV